MNRKFTLAEASSSATPPNSTGPPLPLPHPAEDLSADDDLLSWILVDQLGALPNTRLGVHPQQVKFVGPVFKNEEVMEIIRDTVIKGHLQTGMQKLQDFHLIWAHLKGKTTDGQRDRFILHLRRYLLPLSPTSRVEIYTTPRYSHITGHTELGVFATRPLQPGIVLTELQGSVVPLPDIWREEMEIGEDFAVRAAEEEDDSDFDSEASDTDKEDEDEADEKPASSKDKSKGKERDSESRQRGARRSDRTKRRDFSIVWSGLKRCYQLFLGPARFLNHDCRPNVELLRQGKYVTFRVLQPLKIGEELTTFYGENYFGKANIECLCLTCEQSGQGGFTPKEETSSSRSRSRDVSTAPPPSIAQKGNPKQSSLRNSFVDIIKAEHDLDDDEASTPGPSGSNSMANRLDTPRKGSKTHSQDDDETNADSDSEPEPESPRRERSKRLAAKNIKPWAYLRRPRRLQKALQQETGALTSSNLAIEAEEDELPEDFPRCATCAKPLHERVWYANRYFDHCQRCVRHSLIFDLPWPAHRPQDVLEYPPSHLVPNGYMPRKISHIPLPTLSKKKREAEPLMPPSPLPVTKEQRTAIRLRQVIELQEYIVESLRNEAWTAQEAEEQAELALKEAAEAAIRRKEENKRKRLEDKRRRDENKVRGCGVWSRYEYISEAELERRQKEKMAVTSGTRRGGRFREADDEEEMNKLAELKRNKEAAKRKAAQERSRLRARRKSRREQGLDSDGPSEEGAEPPSEDDEVEDERAQMKAPETETPNSGAREGQKPSPDNRNDDDAAEVILLVEPGSTSSSHSGRMSTPPSLEPARPAMQSTPTRDTAASSAAEGSNSSKRRRGRPPGTGKLQRRARELAMKQQQSEAEGRDYLLGPGRPKKNWDATSPASADFEITRFTKRGLDVISIPDSESVRSARSSSPNPRANAQAGPSRMISGKVAKVKVPSIDAVSEEAKDPSDATTDSSPARHPLNSSTKGNMVLTRHVDEDDEDEIVVAIEPTSDVEIVQSDKIKKRKRESNGSEPAAKKKRTFFTPKVKLPIVVQPPSGGNGSRAWPKAPVVTLPH